MTSCRSDALNHEFDSRLLRHALRLIFDYFEVLLFIFVFCHHASIISHLLTSARPGRDDPVASSMHLLNRRFYLY